MMTLSQNAGIEINLLSRVLKNRSDNLYYSVYVIILAFLSRYKYCGKPSDDWRHET